MMKSFTSMLALLAASAEASGVQWNTAQGIYSSNTYIGEWINPNAFMGIVLILLFFWVTYCSLSMLSEVQTPRIMLEKCIDWGKVEKTED